MIDWMKKRMIEQKNKSMSLIWTHAWIVWMIKWPNECMHECTSGRLIKVEHFGVAQQGNRQTEPPAHPSTVCTSPHSPSSPQLHLQSNQPLCSVHFQKKFSQNMSWFAQHGWKLSVLAALVNVAAEMGSPRAAAACIDFNQQLPDMWQAASSACLTTHSCAQLVLQPYLIKQRISLCSSLPPIQPLDWTKQHEMLPPSQVVPQHIKLGADPHQPPHPVQTPLVGDAATMHHRFPSCGGQDACQAIDGGGLACSIGTQQTETFTCSNMKLGFACCAHCTYAIRISSMHLATCLQLHFAC